MRLFAAKLDSLVAGRGGTLVVSGPVASGKTRLLRAFLMDAADKSSSDRGLSTTLLLSTTGYPATREVPLWLMSQLLGGVELPPELRREMDAALSEPPAQGDLPLASVRLAQRVAEAVLVLAADRPVVLAVDDLQDGDALSLECLVHLARRLVATPVLLVAAVRSGVSDPRYGFHGALLHEGIGSGIRLHRLNERDVATLVAERLGRAVADRVGAACFAATGGNRLLIDAVLEDHTAQFDAFPSERGDTLFVGEAFCRAVLGCLDRSDAATRRTAEVVAMLGHPSSPRKLAELVGLDEHELAAAEATLEAIGVLYRGEFRHSVARDAVLARLTGADRTQIHLRAAAFLQRHDGTIDDIVDHLLAAGEIHEPYAVSLLQCVAERALAVDDIDRAVRCLQLAAECCADERQRAAIIGRLASVVWRTSPIAVAEHHLCALINAIREGTLPDAQIPVVLGYMLWHGRVAEAGDLVSTLYEDDGDPAKEQTRSLEWSLRHTYPALAERIPAGLWGTTDQEGLTPDLVGSGRLLAARLVSEVFAGEPPDRVVIGAQQILQSCPLDEDTLDTLATALIALTYVDRLDLARPWCDELIQRAHERRAPTWAAVLGAVRADIAMREGYMAETVQYAHAALGILPAPSWGVNIGLIRGLLVVAHTRMDEYDKAAEQLRQPLPDGLFESRFGLHYLFGRGQYYQAVDRPYAALSDFKACGDLLSRWGMDQPNIVAWRSAAAQSHLALGQHDHARELAEEQLRLSPRRNSRPAGLALLALAATVPPAERVPLLDAAVEAFTQSGARFHLTRALFDLGRTHHALGDDGKAQLVIRHGRRIEKECRGRQPQPEPGSQDGTEIAEAPRTPWVPLTDELSAAERRVASLAGLGQSNRQIADKLYVTISTVEQHLTRTYRKLGITRRSDITTALRLRTVETV
ncbi:AAA family ATPase [Streptomyces sp. SID3343]|nr:AAA family ATPase [Streptomyces sp. SID3343]